MMIAKRSGSLAARRSAFTLLEVLVVVAILVILAGGASIYMFRYLEDARADSARNNMGELEKACKNYIAKNGGIPPNSLQELVSPTDGNSPFIDGGMNALVDPWGKQYQFDGSHVDNYGSPDPLVFTTNPKTGQPIYSVKRKQ
jgi:general secretion pathway protein G